MPVVFAVALSVAAGLSLAEEHVGPWVAATERPAAHVTNPLGSDQTKALDESTARTVQNEGAAAKERGIDAAGTGDSGRTKASGVGSRALTGNETPDASGQPEMAPGADHEGPPVRLPAADTPE
jgi:hypothetical protein